MNPASAPGILHILPQNSAHGDAFIVGTTTALRYLRAAINTALRHGVAAVEGETVPTDGEGYWLTVHAVAPEAMSDVPLPYAEMDDDTAIPGWLYEDSCNAVARLLARRGARSGSAS